MHRDDLTAEQLKSALSYCPETGEFRWLKARIAANIGTVAGNVHRKGYIYIVLLGNHYRAHRLAFFYMTGRWPSDEIDHRDNVRSNNRWDNLREATTSQNAMNRPSRSGGLRGAHFNKLTGLFHAHIYKDRKQYRLGKYATAEEAHAAYLSAARELHGEFARAN